MSDQDPQDELEIPGLEVIKHRGKDVPLRLRIAGARDRLIASAATQIIKMGKASPRLRDAGLWIYGTATMVVPRGREIPKLAPVGEHVFRGGQPSLRAFTTLHELGIETVINLRPESDHERKFVERLGMRYLYLPLPPLDAPTHEAAVRFLDAATDPANGEVFFHCYHGVDRTGTMAACLRIARDGWTVEAALDEMRAFKVHEVGQRAKLEYLAEFESYWLALPLIRRLEVLHRPLPQDEASVPAPTHWWGRLAEGVKTRVGGLFGRFKRKQDG